MPLKQWTQRHPCLHFFYWGCSILGAEFDFPSLGQMSLPQKHLVQRRDRRCHGDNLCDLGSHPNSCLLQLAWTRVTSLRREGRGWFEDGTSHENYFGMTTIFSCRIWKWWCSSSDHQNLNFEHLDSHLTWTSNFQLENFLRHTSCCTWASGCWVDSSALS